MSTDKATHKASSRSNHQDKPKSKLAALLSSKDFDYDSDSYDDMEDYKSEGGAQLTEPPSEPRMKSIRPLEKRAAILRKARRLLPEPSVYLAELDARLRDYDATLQVLQQEFAAVRECAERAPDAAGMSGEDGGEERGAVGYGSKGGGGGASRAQKQGARGGEVEGEGKRTASP